jgi:hypothetical protein
MSVDPNALLTWGCLLLGLYFAGYAVHSLKTGRTRGYYQDHRYERGERGFSRWVWGRLIAGVVCAGFALLLLV